MNAQTPEPIYGDRSSATAGKTPGSVWQPFAWAIEGLVYAFRTQRNMRIHSVVATMICMIGLWLGLAARDWIIILMLIGLVFAAELMNTAIEAIVDLVSPTPHPLAKIAKDTAAAAVFCLAIISALIGILMVGPLVLARLGLLR